MDFEDGVHLSLSRLNHRLPRGQTDPEVMQSTAQFPHEIADAVLPQPDPVFDDAAALDAPVDRLDPQPTLVQGLVGPLLFQGEFLASGLLGRHEDRDVGQRARQEAQVLQQPTPGGQGRRRRVGHRLLMDAAAVGVAQKEDEEQRMHEQDIFYRVVLCLPALTVGLCNRVLGADDASFRPVMGTRGEAGAAAGTATTGAGASSSRTPTVAASASVTPSRWARAVSERVGAPPWVRSTASSTGKRTWIHWMGFALAHAEQASLDALERVGLEGGEEEEQALFRRRSGTVLVHGKPAGGPGVFHRGATLPYARGTRPRRAESGSETPRE